MMVITRIWKWGLALAALCSSPVVLLAQTPKITSINSGFGTPTNGAAITAGTPQPGTTSLQLFINGTFNVSSAITVTWTEAGVTTPLNVPTAPSPTQVVADVPSTLYQSAGSATITVTETIGVCASACTQTSATATYTVNPIMAQVNTLPNGVVGTAYGPAPFLLSGTGTGPFTAQFTSPPAPPGLSATTNTNTPSLTGTPTTAGNNFPVTPLIADSWGNTLTVDLFVTIIPQLVITTSSLPNGAPSKPYSTPVAATGGVTPYGWIATGLPAGLSINPTSGVISGTPGANSAGVYSVHITVTDSGGANQQTTTTILSLTINPLLTITTTSLPNGKVNTAYSAPVSASGGVTPYAWSATGLPAGLSISPTTGTISGTTSTSGNFSVTITVTDSGGSAQQTAQTTLPLAIFATLQITTTSLPNGKVNTAYSAPVAATGGATPYAWSATGLPAGLSISPTTGTISGTPSASGNFSVTITVTDSGGSVQQTVQTTLPLTIFGTLQITTTSLPNGRVNAAYSAPVTATGGATPYAWSATGLPAGLSIGPTTGTISGTPSASGNFSVTITVTDSGGSAQQTVQTTLPLTIFGALQITTTGLPSATVNLQYTAFVNATGGVTPYTWAAGGLPPGLSINSSSGTISGTPSTPGNYAVTVRVTDSGGAALGQSAQATLSLSVSPAPLPALQITPATLPPGTVGQSYSSGITATGGTGNYSFSLGGGSLPRGITLATNGQIAGTPTASGSFPFTAVVDDGQSRATQSFTIQISPGTLTIDGVPPSSVVANSQFSVQFTVNGGVSPYQLTISGAPPAGTSFSTNGLLSGTLTTPGTYTFTITATDGETPVATASKTFTVIVTPAPITISAKLPAGQVGQAYSGQFSATGGTGGFSWTGTGAGGLSVSSSGAVTGTPAAPGTFSISVAVTDSSGAHASGTYSVTINGPGLTITTTTLPDGALTAAYSATLSATGGTTPYTWTATGLPAGLGVSSSGAISGTPTALGTFTVSVKVTDQSGTAVSATLALTIAPAPLKITTTGISPVPLGQSFSVGFGATGGTAPYTWAATGTPAGVSMASTGTLSGTPTTLGTFSITVTVTDANKQTASVSLSLVVSLPAAPPVNFTGLSTTGTAGAQTTGTVTFGTVYPVDVTVTLTLTFAPASGADDPNIQFATGGRTMTVTIKAGSTASTNVALQTGTVAGVITITSKLTAPDGTDITPSPAPTRVITIGPAAPTISSISVTTNSSGFSITLIGFDPTRAINQATVTFTPAAGSTLQTSTFTIPVSTLFSAWYQSSASVPFGSQFSFTIPFTVTGNLNGIASVTVTLTNPTGTSTSVTANI
jgi:hypothetical protein